MGRLKIEYGIDLGTTNSAIARMENGVSNILEIDNSKTVPSVILYDRRDNATVGIQAKNSPKPTFVEFKRDMGMENLSDYPEEKLQNGTLITAELLSSEVLKKLSERVNDEIFKSVIVTVPAMFEAGQVEATKRAAKMAGFDQVEILMEPVAAATVFAMKNIGKDGTWLIFDFGGGTFDASIVKVEEGIMKVTASEGDNRLGGGDLDRAIINQVMLPQIKKNFNIDDLDDDKRKALNRLLKNEADKIKIELSFKENLDYLSDLGQFSEDADGKDIELEYIFNREEIINLFGPYFQKSIDWAKKLIERKDLTINEIDEFILVGGPTQIPAFRKMIEEQLKKPDTSLNAMTAVAEGAAIYSANIKNEIKEHGNKIGEDSSSEEDTHTEEIEIEYDSNTVNNIEPVSILKKDKTKKLFAILESSDGSWKSSKQELDDVFEVKINDGVNNIKIKVFNENSDLVKCNIEEFNITKGMTNPETSLPYSIGIEIVDVKRKRQIFRSLTGLEVDSPLPAVGLSKPKGELRTMSDIRPGVTDDKILIKLFQAQGASSDAEGTRSKLNKYSGLEFIISGLDVPKLLPASSLINITVNIDRSQTVTFEAEFPELDIIIDELPPAEIKAQVSTTSNEVDDLFKEADKIITDLSSSFPIPDSLNNLKSEIENIKKDWEDNKDSEQTFRNLQGLVIKLDKELDNLEWPKLEENIRKSLQDLETLVNECVEKKLKGHEEDKSNLESFKTNFEQLKPSKNLDLGQSLLENINGQMYQITDRHAGKEQTIAYIRSFNKEFNSVKWKDIAQAKAEVDKGMQMVSFGSSESELKQQLSRIFAQMLDP
ncbi:MAG: Hsp70 family protein, partial [Flavobacteriaceae bacterium]